MGRIIRNDTRPPHRRHGQARRRDRDAPAAEGWQVLAAGSRDGDIARSADAKALVERAARELGGLDVVVNGASAGFAPKPFEDVSEAEVDAALGATVKGSFFVSQAAAPHLRSRRGLVLMIEDVAAYLPWPSFAAHCAAKAAQAMLTRVLSRALAPEVRVCGVAPGRSPWSPDRRSAAPPRRALGHVGSADDVAEAILYLAGAEFVTGATIAVDGGRLLQSGGSGYARHPPHGHGASHRRPGVATRSRCSKHQQGV